MGLDLDVVTSLTVLTVATRKRQQIVWNQYIATSNGSTDDRHLPGNKINKYLKQSINYLIGRYHHQTGLSLNHQCLPITTLFIRHLFILQPQPT